jgi:hypothetical protein
VSPRKPASKYEYQVLCPDGETGEVALHEDMADGWEPVLCWQEPRTKFADGIVMSWINHIILRRKIGLLPKARF